MNKQMSNAKNESMQWFFKQKSETVALTKALDCSNLRLKHKIGSARKKRSSYEGVFATSKPSLRRRLTKPQRFYCKIRKTANQDMKNCRCRFQNNSKTGLTLFATLIYAADFIL